MHEYEVTLRHVGLRKPRYASQEYGFGDNPPIVIFAKNRKAALRRLKLPKMVEVKAIKRVR